MKKFKFNWGWGIAVAYLGFMAMILYLVFGSLRQNVDLVTENYYQKDLEYETHVTKRTNAEILSEKLTIDYDDNLEEITLVFPSNLKGIDGEISCFRPSDKTRDFTTKIELDENFKQVISSKKMINGLWYVHVDWKGNDKAFFSEKSVNVQNSKLVISD